MKQKPDECDGCPIRGDGVGFARPSLSSGYRVMLLGDQCGTAEIEQGKMFQGRAGFKLTRMIEWAGLDRSMFTLMNTIWCAPPEGKLEGTEYEHAATRHCRAAHWNAHLGAHDVIVPMGNVALGCLTGKKGILQQRGYVQPGSGYHILPTVHPAFIRGGQSKYTAVFIRDIQKAVELARGGLPAEAIDYVLDPSPLEAYRWAQDYLGALRRQPRTLLAYDIETPYKSDDEGELDDEDITYHIDRIGFSYRGHSALSVPYAPEYMGTIRALLSSSGEKVVWNSGYDTPRLAHNGTPVSGLIHDGMVAWHILHSDLPKGLGFVATFTCPWQPAWKHLSSARPAFYNATDADVELRSMEVIAEELRRENLWRVYERDVLEIDPILLYMSERGMPIDEEVRREKARILADDQKVVLSRMEETVPQEARKVEHVYAKPPKDTAGLNSREVSGPVRRCSRCRALNPPKHHFRTLKKPTAKRPQNPCSEAGTSEAMEPCVQYYRLAPFKPSRDQLIRYQGVMGRIVPMTKDKKSGKMKPTMDEKAITALSAKFPGDQLYPLVLLYREIDKIAGAYVGRPGE